MAKKDRIEDAVELANGINADVIENEIILSKDGNEVRRKLNPMIRAKIEDGKIKLMAEKSTKRERKNFGSARAHIKNAIEGLAKPWKYKLQIATVHFPTTASIDKENNEFILKNFLGEKKDRRARILPGVEVKISKDIIEVNSADIEKAGQTAANLEKMTKVRFRDRRIFQDGIFITEKPGRSFI